ncbi:uncharacterized protein LOC121727837 [Aricia agestis]|uniref:uncharacterized protein LOC121727837 n=1 Tax=Aricia agestis TaxID=91739 RepID=UPI001C205BB2|nr:uncharacterized protein LOC121727837 [Aricia agestis]
MSKRPSDDEILAKYLIEKIKSDMQADMARRNENVQPLTVVETSLEERDELLSPTLNTSRSRNDGERSQKKGNLKKDILNILPRAHSDENGCKTGEDITEELAESWNYLLANGLDMSDKKGLEAKHLIPKNCPMINAPEINPLLKNELVESVLKKDVEMQNKQKQIALSLTCVSKALSKLIERDGDQDIIEDLVDAGKLLCDFQYYESVARRNAIVVKFNKDLRGQLLENKVDTLLFGDKWKKGLLKQFEDAAMKKQMDLQMQSILLNQSSCSNVDLD